uniref:MD-2-related lipid-recognition domain-containing protein n=1 Tax=Panagrolaimus sp. JU765 TaxID=591449 RepID=A0AC34PVB6_9BILA
MLQPSEDNSNMQSTVVALFAFLAIASACEQWPNGTDTKLNWFQSCTGNVVVHSLQTTDANGNAEYPIHLGKPLYVHLNITNNGQVYNNMKLDTNIWNWGGWTGCSWHSLPTLGLLSNQDACTNGVPCPIPVGNQLLTVTLDFSKYQAIIDLLTNDAPYQLQQVITDSASGSKLCVTVQSRALIH